MATDAADDHAIFGTWLAKLDPFLIKSPSRFRPGPPPGLRSDVYTREFREVKRMGSADSTARSPGQTKTALFFSDIGIGGFQAGMRDTVARRNLDISEAARLFAAVDLSLIDAAIAVWDAKLYYAWWRPITAIQLANTDGNPHTTRDSDWTPLVTNPPYSDYPSGLCGGMAAASRAMAGVLDDGRGRIDINLTSAAAGETRHYTSKAELLHDAIDARVWSGIRSGRPTASPSTSARWWHVGRSPTGSSRHSADQEGRPTHDAAAPPACVIHQRQEFRRVPVADRQTGWVQFRHHLAPEELEAIWTGRRAHQVVRDALEVTERSFGPGRPKLLGAEPSGDHADRSDPGRLRGDAIPRGVAHEHSRCSPDKVERSFDHVRGGFGSFNVIGRRRIVQDAPQLEQVEIMFEFAALCRARETDPEAVARQSQDHLSGTGQRLYLADQVLVPCGFARTDPFAESMLHLPACNSADELVTTHPDVSVQDPPRDPNPVVGERPLPCERVLIDAVDQCPVDIDENCE